MNKINSFILKQDKMFIDFNGKQFELNNLDKIVQDAVHGNVTYRHFFSSLAYSILTNVTNIKNEGIFKSLAGIAVEIPDNALGLLCREIISRKDKALFKKAIQKTLEDESCAYLLIKYNLITRADRKFFPKALEAFVNHKRALEVPAVAFKFLGMKWAIKEDGDIFWRLVSSATKEKVFAKYLLDEEIVNVSEMENRQNLKQ